MPTSHQSWYETAQPELTDCGLWLRGGELNTLPPAEFAARPFRVLFARLSTYADTVESYTHQLLYQVAAGTPGVFPDLAYLPPRADLAVFDRGRVPWLLGTQSKLGPDAFDLLGLSNSIVQELINLPLLLRRSGIPLAKRERLARPDLPLVVLGGANARSSSAVWGPEPLVDAVFVGEDPAAVRRLLEVARDAKASGCAKPEILARLRAAVPGLFEPDVPGPLAGRAAVPDLDAAEPLIAGLVPWSAERLGSGHLQVSEGCPCFCSFCAEAWERKPYREASPGRLLATARRLKAAMGLDTVDLVSFNFNMHTGLYDLLWELPARFRNLGLKSQRFDFLGHEPDLTEILQFAGKTTVTCGLEGISPRLRRYLHKNLDEPALQRSLQAVLRVRPRELKLSLIATGLETTDDLDAFARFLGSLRALRDRARAQTRLVFSMTPLVRFPWTPLEFEDAPPPERVEEVLRETRRRAENAGCEFRSAADATEYAVCQVLARAAAPGVTRALVRAAGERPDTLYYRSVTREFAAAFAQALTAERLNAADLRRGATLEESAAKPWARLDTGVRREFLWAAGQRARRGEELEYCLGRPWAQATCAACGACPSPEAIRRLVTAARPRPYTAARFRARLQACRADLAELPLLVEVGDAALGIPRQAVAVALARALMLADDALVDPYRGSTGPDADEEPAARWLTGPAVVLTRWTAAGAAHLAAHLADPGWRARVNAQLGAWGRLLGQAPPDWRPTAYRLVAPFAADPALYLNANGLKHTLRREPNGGYACQLTPQARRRNLLVTVRYRSQPPADSWLEVEPGPKFRLGEFVTATLRLPTPAHLCQVRITAVATLAP